MALYWRLAPPKHSGDVGSCGNSADDNASEASNLRIDTDVSHGPHRPRNPNESAPRTNNEPSSSPPCSSRAATPTHDNDLEITHLATHVYVVTSSHLVRSGPYATIEAPVIRTEVISVCFSADRAREIAHRVWRQRFGYDIPEGKVEEFDAIEYEYFFRPTGRGSGRVRISRSCDGGGNEVGGGMEDGGGRVEELEVERGIELLSLLNKTFLDPEDGHAILEGERRVSIWSVGVDGSPGARGEGDGGRTPESV